MMSLAVAVIAIIIGACECFVGYKSIKEIRPVLGFLSGASLGVCVGLLTQNFSIGISAFFALGIFVGILSYFIRCFGIIGISTLFGLTSGVLLFGNIIPGIIIGTVCLFFTMFFYKLGAVVSSALYGSGLIIYSVLTIIEGELYSSEGFPVITIIWMISTVAGIICQIVTTFCDDFGQRNVIDTVKDYSDSGALIEKKYPRFQKAFRNFCIKCGYDMSDLGGKCPRCGFDFDE